MKILLYENRAEPKSISVISILLLAASLGITKLRCMHRECYIFVIPYVIQRYDILCHHDVYFANASLVDSQKEDWMLTLWDRTTVL